jgi:hypothetical protein
VRAGTDPLESPGVQGLHGDLEVSGHFRGGGQTSGCGGSPSRAVSGFARHRVETVALAYDALAEVPRRGRQTVANASRQLFVNFWAYEQ